MTRGNGRLKVVAVVLAVRGRGALSEVHLLHASDRRCLVAATNTGRGTAVRVQSTSDPVATGRGWSAHDASWRPYIM